MPALTRKQSQDTLFHVLDQVLVAQQRSANGQNAAGTPLLFPDDVLAVLARLAARTVNVGATQDRRMQLAAGFDNNFLDEHHRLEQLRLLRH